MPDNRAIGRGLRDAHNEAMSLIGGKRRSIRLPAERDIEFFKSGPDAHIHMQPTAVVANMQTNSAGFEGWSLALRLWLQFREVTLHWSPPARLPNQPLNRHYARFLYRAQRFSELFPWFHVGTPEHLADCAIRADGDLFLNVAGSVSREPVDPARETKIERGLVGQHSCLLREALRLEVVDRQFPVGLYRTADLKMPIFTGGTSAIDIVGVKGREFSVIELKAGKNIMVGALGELLFYASVVRDAAGGNGRFRFGGRSDGKSRSDIGARDVLAAEAVRAILMAEEFHPLLEHPDLFSTLNAAAFAQRHPVALTFECWRLDDYDTEAGPSFRRLAA